MISCDELHIVEWTCVILLSFMVNHIEEAKHEINTLYSLLGSQKLIYR